MESDIDKLKELAVKKANSLVIYTSGQISLLDNHGNEVVRLEKEFIDGNGDLKLLKTIASSCQEFAVSKWPYWFHKLTREEFFNIVKI